MNPGAGTAGKPRQISTVIMYYVLYSSKGIHSYAYKPSLLDQ